MPVGLSSSNVSRLTAGTLAALWAMAGLANDYAIIAAVGPSLHIVLGIITNVALALGASLALVNAQGWRVILMTTLVVVTIERIIEAALSGPPLARIAGAIIAFAAIAGAAFIAPSRRG